MFQGAFGQKRSRLLAEKKPAFAGFRRLLTKSNKETPKVQRLVLFRQSRKRALSREHREYREYREYPGTGVTAGTSLLATKWPKEPLFAPWQAQRGRTR